MRATEVTDNFNFFAPVTISKGEIDGKKVMKMGGVASTSSKDADGEFLNPTGFDLDYFMSKGFMNWNHQTSKDPLSYIGRPTKGEITNRGLEIECELFANNPKAQQVYELAEVLNSNGMQLGFSIEGKVTKRNAKNPKIVEKATITGCAITPNPKNEDAIAEIIKGHGSDIIGGDDTITLSGDFDLLKGMSAYEDESEETTEKAMMAGGNMRPVVKESLDGDVKHTEKSSEVKKACSCGMKNCNCTKKAFCAECDSMPCECKLSKGDVYSKIYSDFPEIEDSVATQLYNLIETINSKMENTNITSEDISKAYEALGLEETAVEETVENTVEETVEEVVNEEIVNETEETEEVELEKGEDSVELSWDDLDVTDEEVEAAKEILSKANINFSIEETTEEVEELEKGLIDETLEDNTDELVTLIKGRFDELAATAEETALNTATIIKGLENQLNEVRTENANLRADVDTIGGQSQGRKSATISKAVSRSFGDNDESDIAKGSENLKVLSKSKDRGVILDTLEKGYFDSATNSVTNNTLANEAMIFESSKQISGGIIDYMKSQGFQLVG